MLELNEKSLSRELGTKRNLHFHFGTIAIIWEGKDPFLKGFAAKARLTTWTALKEWWMNQKWKNFYSLNFGSEFILSFIKLLFFWNPIWTFLVSLVLEGFNKDSVLFRWGWSFFEATVVGFFGMAVIGLFLLLERIWTSYSPLSKRRHGTGWYLMFLAFMVPPGLYLALHLMVAYINFFYPGAPITAEFHWQYYGNEIFWGWMLLLFFFLFKSWQDLRDAARFSQLKAEELEKERLQALLTKLKDQMNPHFLFNTLNTVASLIHADPEKAEKVVVKLSTLFQGVLSATRKTNHSLESELEFCRDYLDIEQVRFGSRLNARFELEAGLDLSKVFVPVLLFQPLVENAVKHGLSSRASGGNVWIGAGIREGHLKLWVEDDGVGFGHSPYAGSGTALDNCRKRLELGFAEEGRMEIQPRTGGGTRVLLTLPVILTDTFLNKVDR